MYKNNIKKTLTLEELGFLETEMLKSRKSKEAAWGLWAGLSFFGAHRFYTENYGYASIMLSTTFIPLIAIIIILSSSMIGPVAAFFLYIFFAMLFGSVIWSWIDALFLNKRLDSFNNELELNIINRIKEKEMA